MWIQIISFYEECINSLTVIEENRQKTLLCYLYCIYIPKILDLFTKMKSLFSKTPLEELEKLPDLEDTSFEDG